MENPADALYVKVLLMFEMLVSYDEVWMLWLRFFWHSMLICRLGVRLVAVRWVWQLPMQFHGERSLWSFFELSVTRCILL